MIRRFAKAVVRRGRAAALNVGANVARYTHNDLDRPELSWLWSKGVARLCDYSGPPGYWARPTESIQPTDLIAEAYSDACNVVWVRLGTRSRDGEQVDLDAFARQALPRIRRPFVLLTTDGDATVPSELCPDTVTRLLSSAHLRAWYTQNCDVRRHPVIRPFPIGLSLHNSRIFGSPRKSAEELRLLAFAARPAHERPLSVYSDISVSLASEERRQADGLFRDVSHVRSQRLRVSQHTTWQRYSQSRFVLSLKGNGIDAHRTWEALYLGGIVITLRSTLDPLYEGLPVVLADRLEDIADPRNLVRWSEQYLPLTVREEVWGKLDARRWMDKLRQHLG